ncbi:hypothetical protein, partial [Paraherbaspirillum soli]
VKEPGPLSRRLASFASPTKRFVCQQQRDEIMWRFQFFVNYFLLLFRKTSLLNHRFFTCFPSRIERSKQPSLPLYFASFSTGGEL